MTWISRIGFVLDLLSITSMSTSQSKGDLRGRAVCGRFRAHSKFQALGWWNGRHVRLRGVCRKACGFKSRPEHYSIRRCVAGSDNCPNPRKDIKSAILFFWRDPRICSVARISRGVEMRGEKYAPTRKTLPVCATKRLL